MIGATYMDGVDIWTAYGAFVDRGSYKGLISFPPLKKIDTNDWPDEDGIEVDLSSPVLDTKDFSVTFAAKTEAGALGLIEAITTGNAYKEFEFKEIAKTVTLRLLSQSAMQINNGLTIFSLQFADDAPLHGYTYTAPESAMVAQRDYTINGINAANYGLVVLQGTRGSLKKTPPTKTNLLNNINTQTGASYDGENVFLKSKEVTLSCVLIAANKTEFWQNYNALLFDLIRPGLQYLGFNNEIEPFYYKESSVSGLTVSPSKIWVELSITLVFPNLTGSTDLFCLLATEAGELIPTENNEFIIVQ